jgi:hypothetical protein
LIFRGCSRAIAIYPRMNSMIMMINMGNEFVNEITNNKPKGHEQKESAMSLMN